MPLYDFKCKKCAHEFEENLSLNEENKTIKCPKCKGKSDKLITNPVHYKHLSWSTWRIGQGQ